MTEADQPPSHCEQTDDDEQLVAAEGDETHSAAEVAAVHEIPREQPR